MLGKLRNIVDLNTSLIMYKTLVIPIYDYRDFLLMRITNQDAESLQKLQNCAFRGVLRVDRFTPTNQAHETLNMDTLHFRQCRHVATQMYKYLHGDASPECTNMFEYVSASHDVNTRLSHTSNLVLPRVHLAAAERKIRYHRVQIWAQVPEDVKRSETMEKFKNSIKTVDFS